MSADITEESKRIKEQLRQGIREAESSIKKSREYLAKNGYDPDSKELQTMLENAQDPEIKRRYEQYREELQQEIERERARLRQSHSSSSNSGSRRRPVGGVKI